jgi:hypothetical protein
METSEATDWRQWTLDHGLPLPKHLIEMRTLGRDTRHVFDTTTGAWRSLCGRVRSDRCELAEWTGSTAPTRCGGCVARLRNRDFYWAQPTTTADTMAAMTFLLRRVAVLEDEVRQLRAAAARSLS